VHLSTFFDEYEDHSYFVSIDSDLEILNRYETNNIFSKLVSHDLDFVGGLYSLKRPGNPICSSVPMDRNRNPELNSGLKKMLWLSSGCWCLKRSMIESMIERYKFLIYDGDDNMSKKKIYGLYMPFIKEIRDGEKTIKKYLSEDWAFSSRWKDMGGEIYADTSIVLNHYGETAFPLWNVEMVVKSKEEGPYLPEPGYDLEPNFNLGE
jgi:hypothetical protein